MLIFWQKNIFIRFTLQKSIRFRKKKLKTTCTFNSCLIFEIHKNNIEYNFWSIYFLVWIFFFDHYLRFYRGYLSHVKRHGGQWRTRRLVVIYPSHWPHCIYFRKQLIRPVGYYRVIVSYKLLFISITDNYTYPLYRAHRTQRTHIYTSVIYTSIRVQAVGYGQGVSVPRIIRNRRDQCVHTRWMYKYICVINLSVFSCINFWSNCWVILRWYYFVGPITEMLCNSASRSF